MIKQNETIANLELKLAEKEKEIAELKQRLKDTIKIYSDDFVEKDKEIKELRFRARNIFPLVENLEDKVNQDKIAFAVGQLEKVKEDINCYMAIREGDLTDSVEEVLIYFADKIDNKIKQLKESR